MLLIIVTPVKVPLILGNPHLELAEWLDEAQARLQALVKTEGRQCLEEAISA